MVLIYGFLLYCTQPIFYDFAAITDNYYLSFTYFLQVDGNEVVTVREATRFATQWCRDGNVSFLATRAYSPTIITSFD